MRPLEGKCVVLGVTGGIAVYKACELTSRLRKAGADVFVVMTKNACQFVQPLTFETLSNHPVATDTFKREGSWEVEHVALAKRADLFVIAPATANICAKMAMGIADDMLSTTVLATKAPILVAPAMNTGMWENAATQQNMQTLARRGMHFVGPEGGYLACGDSGMGRLSEAETIYRACESILCPKQDMAGIKVLVTAGPTREMLDPVRYLTNRSSGKMGYAIAEMALKRGAEVTLVTGPVNIPAPKGCRIVSILTTQELHENMLDLCGEMDMIIQAAAPADYTPVQAAQQKIKKQKGEPFVLELKETPDVAAAVGAVKKDHQVLVGFAAETELVLENARKKLKSKNLSMICANDVSRKDAGFDVDTNCLTLITADETVSLPLMTKHEAADALLSAALKLKKN
ncbi:MAG: bifunctional phosphopantothenoylcysteine decarboxylase/phosphopantothenate--cysteine ligase CoaBC [Clostridia bacterium]|nr:bifunctional phosphopantothenoylcysteine decarboxylase/phosphopantothenate--cysteine ligase CoaBC [Clostridia bacterium]